MGRLSSVPLSSVSPPPSPPVLLWPPPPVTPLETCLSPQSTPITTELLMTIAEPPSPRPSRGTDTPPPAATLSTETASSRTSATLVSLPMHPQSVLSPTPPTDRPLLLTLSAPSSTPPPLLWLTLPLLLLLAPLSTLPPSSPTPLLLPTSLVK